MIRHRTPPSPPRTTADLLRDLRSARLLTPRQARRWERCWAAEGDAPAGSRISELTGAGVLTPYQAERMRAGRARGLRLGPYRVLDRLGAGGMGRVFKAEHRLMKRVVALKVIARLPRRGAAAARAAALARFRREVEAAARLAHPHVALAHDAALARGRLFLVLEYVPGVDLGGLVARHGPLPVALACAAVRQAALALAHAHARGLVHGDVKPANLLLATGAAADASGPPPSQPSLADGTSLDGTAVVKLLDLGLARPARARRRRRDLGGTPDFMAPEQWADGHRADARADLYALGCTFYYLLTGWPPFPGGTWTEKLLRHRLDTPRPIVSLRPEVPEAVAVVATRMMAKDPADRFPDLAEVAAALDEGNVLSSPTLLPVGGAAEAFAPSAAGEGKLTRPDREDKTPLIGEEPPEPDAAGSLPSTPSLPSLPEADWGDGEGPQPAAAKPARRRLVPELPAVLLAAGLGVLGAWLARDLSFADKKGRPTPPTTASTSVPAPAGAAPLPTPFRVERLGRDFAGLQEAVTAALDGDVVTVSGGTYRPGNLSWTGKALRLRGAPGARPRFVSGPSPVSWQALVTTDRELTLEGIDLAHEGTGPGEFAPLVRCDGAALRLAGCRVESSGPGPAVVVRGGPGLTLDGSRVGARSTPLAIEATGSGSCRVALRGSTVSVRDPSGAALALWAAEGAKPGVVDVRLERNTVTAGRVAAFRALPGGVRVVAEGNDFSFREAVVSFTGWGVPTDWRESAAWSGRGNRYRCDGGAWVRVDGRPAGLPGLEAWQELWGAAEPGSSESTASASARPARPGGP